jgi:hypothetical protein
MKVHDFPVTDDTWTAYLHDHHYARFGKSAPVVNVLFAVWNAAHAPAGHSLRRGMSCGGCASTCRRTSTTNCGPAAVTKHR